MNIQQLLDSWLGTHPEAQRFVTKLCFIPDGTRPPPEVTHTFRLRSTASADRQVLIGVVVTPEFALILRALLGLADATPLLP